MSVHTHCPPWVQILEDTDSVRSPGWYEGDCWNCDGHTSGSEPVVEDWASEHWRCAPTALETLPIRRRTSRRLGIRQPCPCQAIPRVLALSREDSLWVVNNWGEASRVVAGPVYFVAPELAASFDPVPYHYEGQCERPRRLEFA